MSQPRRPLLRRALLLGGAGLAGCVTGQNDDAAETSGDGSPTSTGGDVPTVIRFWLEAVALSESERDAIDPITFSDLTNGEREIVQMALEAGEYTSEIGEESAALDRLRDRISARTGGGVEAYLERGGTSYRIGFVAGDHIVADPGH